MPKKVIIDCDPGIDDAVALCLALFDPRLEVLGVTAVEGNISAERASLNVQTVIDQLDPPRYPRVGAATPLEAAPALDMRHLHGENGLANVDFAVSQLHHQHPSEKILCDELRAAPEQVTLICMGPLSNLARAFRRDPSLPLLIDQVIISGGTAQCVGNVTPVAEFNMFYDPVSARTVFRSPITKILIPLEVTQQVPFTLDLVEHLPASSTRAGRLLRRLVPFAFRAYRQHLGQESMFLQDAVALVAALHPELFVLREMEGDVETIGELTRGVTVFDRRRYSLTRSTTAVATEVDVAAVTDCILRGLAEAGRAT
jgi:inosine-uridine nucleoside N-ribohydrolase